MNIVKIIGTIALLYSSAWIPADAAEQLSGLAHIRFHGTSTLHDFDGFVQSRPFTATLRTDLETGALQLSAAAIVPVPDMTTHHAKRDRNMRRMLDESHFKTITGQLSDVTIPKDTDAEAVLHVSICEVEQDIPVRIEDWEQNDHEVACRLRFPVSLQDFGLKAPSVLGIIRVGDTVDVECTIKGQLSPLYEQEAL